MKRFCLALDLKEDNQLIQEYEDHHQKVWPEIIESLKTTGILKAEIYRTGNRLLMIMETEDSFTLEQKTQSDSTNPIVQKWETLMWKYQQPLPNAKPGEKWVLMGKIFSL